MSGEGQEMKLLESFKKDSEWFHKNIDELRKRGFTGKFVAVKDEKPIASDKNIDIVIKTLEGKGQNPSFLFIEFVYPEGYTLLL